MISGSFGCSYLHGMAIPNPYLNTEEDFDPALHWGAFPGAYSGRTFTGQTVAGHDPSDYFFGRAGGEVSLQGIIDAKRIRGCARWFLGYNNQTTASSYTLQRENPAVHPRFTNTVCTGISFREFVPIRKNAPNTSRNSGLKLANNDESSGTVAVFKDGGTVKTLPYYTGYQKAMVTARFGPAMYRYRPDAPGLKEYWRNTIIDTEPRTEVLTLSGFQLIYAEGGTNTAPRTNAKGKVSPADQFQVLIKPDLKVTWFDVPEKFISKNSVALPGQVFPEKIVKGLGTLNRYDWINWKKGTLLYVAAHLVRRPWILAAGGNRIDEYPNNVRESDFNYDVEMLFSYFDPPKGFDTDTKIVNPDTFGHNNQPYRGEPTGAALLNDDPNAGQWFFATYSGKLLNIGSDPGPGVSQGIYRYSAYDNLFDSVWNPDIT